MFSRRVSSISDSITLALNARAKELKAKGIDVISFAAGEPDFDTPDFIKRAAIEAINKGYTHYTPASGTPELKDAICKKFKKDNDLKYVPPDILVSSGAKHAIYNIILALCEEGDEIIVPAPYWISYPEIARLSGAKPVHLKTNEENCFKITPEDLKKALTSNTKVLILNSPNNPTGAVYTKDELVEISKIVLDADIYVISDEIYEMLIYGDSYHVSIAQISNEIKKKTFVVNGLSKCFAMTGWRIGYVAGEETIIKRAGMLQSHSTANPNSIAQYAATIALASNEAQDAIQKMRFQFDKRRSYITERLKNIPNITLVEPLGAFYAFPNVSFYFGRTIRGNILKGSHGFCEAILEEAKVAIVPGEAFGAPSYVRFSYASSLEDIKIGLDRFEEFLKQLD